MKIAQLTQNGREHTFRRDGEGYIQYTITLAGQTLFSQSLLPKMAEKVAGLLGTFLRRPEECIECRSQNNLESVNTIIAGQLVGRMMCRDCKLQNHSYDE